MLWPYYGNGALSLAEFAAMSIALLMLGLDRHVLFSVG